MEPKTVAYLILAHSNPKQLSKLLGALAHPNAEFYVHIDLNVSIQPFFDVVGNSETVHFVDRIKVRWAAISVVEATLTLMRAAHSRANYRFYTLLSGSDYPIKNNSAIIELFDTTNKEHIHYWKLSDMESWQHKVQYHYPINLVSMHDYQKVLHRRIFWGTFIKLRRFFPKRRFPAGLEPYGGPQWWSLSHACVSFVLEFVDANPSLLEFYRTTHSPDEGFFHTVIMNSQFGSRAAGLQDYERWCALAPPHESEPPESNYIRYAHWAERASVGSPGTLNERHFQMLIDSGKVFARKFDLETSAKLLDMIDNHRRESADPHLPTPA